MVEPRLLESFGTPGPWLLGVCTRIFTTIVIPIEALTTSAAVAPPTAPTLLVSTTANAYIRATIP